MLNISGMLEGKILILYLHKAFDFAYQLSLVSRVVNIQNVKISILLKVCHIFKKRLSILLVWMQEDDHSLTGIGYYKLIYEFWYKN